MMKIFLKIILFLMLIVFIADIAASFYFYNISISRTKKDFLAKDTALKKSIPASAEVYTNLVSENKIDFFNKQTYKEVDIISEDGLKLKAYYLKAKNPTSKTVILAHGYSSQGTFMSSYAKLYYENFGYNVLLPDSRGHGKSEGKYIGLGWVDRKDYLIWIDFVINTIGNDSQIVVHGVSMGGATVLMTSGEVLPKNVKALVSDCAYTSVVDEFKYQLKRMYNLPSFPILNSTSLLSKIRAGYFFEEASALEQVKKSKTPILFIHGDSDKFVPFNMVKELYNACNSEKDILNVPNAGHGAAYSTDINRYQNKIDIFIGKYVK